MKLYNLLKDSDYEIISGSVDIDARSVSYDSRKVKGDSVFICIKGANADGHDYIDEAIKSGALAIVIQEEIKINNENITVIKVRNTKLALASIANMFYNEPSKEINLVGVTGTNGKTTVIHYIKDILESYKKRTAIIGTLGYESNKEKASIQKVNPTTPESLELQGLFREFINKGAENIIMEVTSSALARQRVEYCDFNVGVFTNLSQDHLEEHGTMENYKNEKIKLFEKCELGVINIDDGIAEEIIEKASCKILTYGINKEADIRATEIRYRSDSIIFKIKFRDIKWRWWCITDVKVNIPGKVTVYNVLAAIGACIGLGMDMGDVISCLSNLKHVPGRLEMVKNNSNKNVIVDYAHTPDALERLLMMARETTKGKLITVFGCGGDRDKSKRKVMGMAAGILSDYCIITSDNPRTEDPIKIIEDIEEGMEVINSTYEKIVDRKKAIEKGLKLLKEDDLLIIAGKGHEDYQIIGKDKIYFDDREIVRRALG
ncbi:UDP-N-acetylmuramoyl-L-alanyl-D-glutamate--2,6-diaminopimelate ligase [Clostridium beijerinckii]|uniref:UDP-N-acetylmuramoyl-L-alanyl-D-glutamate--2,6-diaminopimelate ligase n=1 Tax=Clostridium beijerinckii TaxID=1520 RepID=A0A0B5QMM6_CLOBE|nr:UDP-N-acetylmuramoyl-L-alanyl-D-glutamate--2,6-diaminopimelate ligase [Clostridium beijerinckii]AJG98053.1 UDP-N-acetylmuramoyl-L-alanyl-D-glutamate--2,6-diaminopimelate ligase [Clostridium beijerinckii]